MEAIHIQKYIHTSPRKLRLMADMVRNISPAKALDLLVFTPKAASDDLLKAIKTALGNAKQAGLDQSQLNFKKIEINESMKMRRFRAGTRGRAKPYRKKMAHIKIILTDDLKLKTPVKDEARQRRQKSKVKTEKQKKEEAK
ncbi:50S ribosomal protein L22 [Candidatus Daviesbacteria bacterium]|nr:50S ribosomal protein L22 [Candidatus Daviesbacteria bacterium]